MKRWITWLVSVPAAIALVLMVVWMAQRMPARVAYPFDIEWMEGGMLAHALRLREGLTLYTEPSADWIPYIYPPLYPWVVGTLGAPTYALARTVSVVCTALAALACTVGVWRERVNPVLALGAGALFLSSWDASGAFYDLVRNDALAICLAGWSLVLVRQGAGQGEGQRSWGLPAVIGGAVLLALAFLAKHNYAAFGLPMALWLFWQDRQLAPGPWQVRYRRTLAFVGLSAGLALLATVVIQITSGGTFLTYLIGVPGVHPLKAERAWPKSEIELLTSYTFVNVVAWIAGGVWLVRRRVAKLEVAPGPAFWGPIALLAAGLCVLMRAHHGGFVNVLMPGHWVLALVGVAALGALTRDSPLGTALIAVLVLGQAVEGRFGYPWAKDLDCAFADRRPSQTLADQCFQDDWRISRMVPTQADIDAGNAVVETLRAIDGPVFAPHFPWYPYLAGKEPSLPLIALWDIDHARGPLYQETNPVEQAMAEHKWAAVLLPAKPMKNGLQQHYRRDQRNLTTGGAMKTRTGWSVQPREIWVPKESAQ